MIYARWDPLYDLYATSEDGKPSTSVSLHYRANLCQRSGEDWTNAKLILSTSATDVLDAGIPKPDSLIIQPPLPSPSSHSPKSPAYSPASLKEEEDEESDQAFGLFDYEDDDVFPDPIDPLPKLAQSAAVISKSPMAVSYTVEALTTIPSDGVSYNVLVAIVPFDAVITHIATPSKSPIAYLQVLEVALLLVLN